MIRNRSLGSMPAKPPSKQRGMNLREFHRNVRMARALFRVFVIFVIMWVPVAVLILMGKGKQVNYVWYILTVLLAHGNSSVNCVVYALSLEHFREGYARLLGMTSHTRNEMNTVDTVTFRTRDRTRGTTGIAHHTSNASPNAIVKR